MATEVLLPRLGWSMEEGSLVEWLKRDGDRVAAGDLICRIEGDKAIDEVESFDSGILRIPPSSPAPGVKVPVGTLLAYLVKPGERAPFEDEGVRRRPNPLAPFPPREGGTPSPPLHPQMERGRGGEAGPPTPTISPRARRIAAELGVEWASLRGSGRTGRIVERDVREAAARSLAPVAADAAQRVPLAGIRQIIAARMAESAHTVAPVTLTTEADATDLARLREQIKADLAGSDWPVPSYNDLFAKLVATALREHPALNASLDGQNIVQHSTVNVGIAVDTDRGLLVPVIRDVQTKSVQQIAIESERLISATRTGHVSPDDLRGGTFTITNLGIYEIDAFTPIINLPECAILGTGRIVARPVVVDEASEKVAVRKMVALSLTFDHRLVDGAPAARFLQRVKYFVEHPTLWLIR